MFGILIDGPANVFCDNRGVVKNLSVPESTLMKKHNAINYHVVEKWLQLVFCKLGRKIQ